METRPGWRTLLGFELLADASLVLDGSAAIVVLPGLALTLRELWKPDLSLLAWRAGLAFGAALWLGPRMHGLLQLLLGLVLLRGGRNRPWWLLVLALVLPRSYRPSFPGTNQT